MVTAPMTPRPPVILRALLAALLPGVDRRHLLEEIDALYRTRLQRDGALRARLWYARTVAGFAVRLTRERLVEGAIALRADQRAMLRFVLRRKGFAAATVLTLAVGLAGITTIYAIADWVLLRPVPGVRAPQELVLLRLGTVESDRPSWPVAHADYEDFRAGIDDVESLAASRPVEVNLQLGAEAQPLRVAGAVVTSNWFRTLGVSFVAGRELSSAGAEERAGVGEAVVEHGVASTVAADPAAAVGRTIVVNGRPFTIVGVTAAGFRGTRFPGLERAWFASGSASVVDPSLSIDAFADPYEGVWTDMVGRLRPGRDAAAVEIAANGVRERIQSGDRPHQFVVVHWVMQATSRLGLDLGLHGVVGQTLLLLGVGGLFLLLLSITNVANLGLMHTASRRAVFTVQRALGIGRLRLLRQVLVEYLLIGVLSGITTVTLVAATAQYLRGIQLDEFGGSLAGFVVEPRVMVVSGVVALLSGLLAGVGPAALVLRQKTLENLRGGGDAPRSARRLRDALVIAQVAVSATLLVGAGLMARTVTSLESVDLGFDPAGVLSFTIDPESQDYTGEQVDQLLARLTEGLQGIPGAAVGFVYPQPLRTGFVTSFLSRTSDPQDPDRLVGSLIQVSEGFLDALGVRVLAGEIDTARWGGQAADAAGTVLLNRAAAVALLPDVDITAVPGTQVWRGGRPGGPVPVEIAAVVEDIKTMGPAGETPPIFFWPWAQGGVDGPPIAWLRAPHLSTAELVRTVQETTHAIAPAIPPYAFETVEDRVATISARERVVAALAVSVSVLGLLLAAIGLYGVLGYAVTERRREIGIRSALGAEPGKLRRLVLAGGVGRVMIGVVPGLAGAVAASLALESFLFGVAPFDPVTYLSAAGVLIVTGLAASWLPARWAASVSPVDVLRVDQ